MPVTRTIDLSSQDLSIEDEIIAARLELKKSKSSMLVIYLKGEFNKNVKFKQEYLETQFILAMTMDKLNAHVAVVAEHRTPNPDQALFFEEFSKMFEEQKGAGQVVEQIRTSEVKAWCKERLPAPPTGLHNPEGETVEKQRPIAVTANTKIKQKTELPPQHPQSIADIQAVFNAKCENKCIDPAMVADALQHLVAPPDGPLITKKSSLSKPTGVRVLDGKIAVSGPSSKLPKQEIIEHLVPLLQEQTQVINAQEYRGLVQQAWKNAFQARNQTPPVIYEETKKGWKRELFHWFSSKNHQVAAGKGTKSSPFAEMLMYAAIAPEELMHQNSFLHISSPVLLNETYQSHKANQVFDTRLIVSALSMVLPLLQSTSSREFFTHKGVKVVGDVKCRAGSKKANNKHYAIIEDVIRNINLKYAYSRGKGDDFTMTLTQYHEIIEHACKRNGIQDWESYLNNQSKPSPLIALLQMAVVNPQQLCEANGQRLGIPSQKIKIERPKAARA